MYRTTTPTHTFTLPIDTSECAVIKVTYLQDAVRLVKLKQGADISPGMTLDEDCVVINLTQEETKAFKPGQVQVQLRALTNGGKSYQGDIDTVSVGKVLDDEILTAEA